MSDVSSKVVDIIVDKLGVAAAEFEISIPDEDAEKITTVGDAINYISEKKK